MKKIIFTLIVFISFLQLSAQESYFGKQINAFNLLSSQDSYTAINSEGFHFVTGVYEDSVSVDNEKLVSTTVNQWYDEHSFLVKLAPTGNLDTMITSTGPGHLYVREIEMSPDDDFYIRGTFYGVVAMGSANMVSGNSIGSDFIIKFDKNLNVIWSKVFPHISNTNYSRITNMQAASSNRLALFGFVKGIDTIDNLILNEANGRAFVAYADALNGNFLWAEQIFHNNLTIFGSPYITSDQQNNIYVSGSYGNTSFAGNKYIVFNTTDSLFVRSGFSLNYQAESYVAKYDSSGNYQWSSRIDTMHPNQPRGITVINSNLRIGANNGIYNINSSGQILQIDTMQGGFLEQLEVADNSLYARVSIIDSMLYKGQTYIDTLRNKFLVKFDSNANLLWLSAIPDTVSIPNFDVNEHNVISLTGTTFRRINFTDFDILYNDNLYYSFCLAIKDTINAPNMNTIKGRVFNDTNQNCQLDIAEQGIDGITVVATPGPYYTKTDSNGHYEIKVDTGSYTISPIAHSGFKYKYQSSCAINSLNSINFIGWSSLIDSNNNFPSSIEKCHLIRSAFVNPYIRNSFPCNLDTSETYFIIENWGSDTAFNVEAKLKYPGVALYPIFSSPAWTSYSALDSVVTWNFPFLAPNQSILVRVKDTVNCTEVTPNAQYPYALKTSPLNQCNLSDTMYNRDSASISFLLPLSTQDVKVNKVEIKYYPNPANSNIQIGLSNEDLMNAELNVFDLSGRIVLKKEIDLMKKSTMSLDVGFLNEGYYLFRIRNKEKGIIQLNKILIKR